MEEAAKGQSFIIAKAGKPMVRVMPLEDPAESYAHRFGFLRGQLKVPEDFDTLMSEQIKRLFYGEDD